MRTQPSKIVRRGRYFAFVIFIFGNFRLTAAITEACSGFPELLAKASRAWAASGIGYFLVLFSTKSDCGSFFLAAVVSLAINDDSPLGRTCRNFCFGLPTDSVHSKLSEQEVTVDMSTSYSLPPPGSFAEAKLQRLGNITLIGSNCRPFFRK